MNERLKVKFHHKDPPKHRNNQKTTELFHYTSKAPSKSSKRDELLTETRRGLKTRPNISGVKPNNWQGKTFNTPPSDSHLPLVSAGQVTNTRNTDHNKR